MPQEVLYKDYNDLLERLKAIAARGLQECRVKVNKDNVKLKLRTRRRLYTVVLRADRVSDVQALKQRAQEIAKQIGCTKVVEVA